MKPKIEKPHIFISYAWGSEENQQRVIEFATSLAQYGIDVELDKWSLKEGNDTYAYMEQMVSNNDITNVLILLDENYMKKANERKGGVGTETQILSPEIYEKTKQEKFIPIVFSRGANGEICKPSFLKGILHFDLSQDDKYASEFERLVKRLYGVEIFKKPEIGKQPSWLFEEKQVINAKIAFSSIFNAKSDIEKQYEIRQALSKIKNDISAVFSEMNIEETNIIDSYKNTHVFRDTVLSLIVSCQWSNNFGAEISSFFEELKNEKLDDNVCGKLKDTLVHEMFVYAVAMLLKAQNYQTLGYVLNKTYFPEGFYEEPRSFQIFYINNDFLDSVVSKRDGKRYYSGTSQLWIECINLDYLTRNEFVGADDLLYNVAIFGSNYLDKWWAWFPVSYIYDNSNTIINHIRRRLSSREFVEKIRVVFGYSDSESFIKALNNKTAAMLEKNRYRYPAAWHEAPLITDDIKLEEIGKYN